MGWSGGGQHARARRFATRLRHRFTQHILGTLGTLATLCGHPEVFTQFAHCRHAFSADQLVDVGVSDVVAKAHVHDGNLESGYMDVGIMVQMRIIVNNYSTVCFAGVIASALADGTAVLRARPVPGQTCQAVAQTGRSADREG